MNLKSLSIVFLAMFATNTALAQENPLGVRGREEKTVKPAIVLDDKKPDPPKVETPPAANLPTPVTTTDAGKETPKSEPPAAPVCVLPPPTLPIQFTELVRDELVVAGRNNAALTAYADVYKAWAEKRADFDMCKLQGGTCKEPANMPQQPKQVVSFLEYLKKSGAPAQQAFYTKVGNWLVCTEITRAVALKTCQNGYPEILTNLEQELKKRCPLLINRRRR